MTRTATKVKCVHCPKHLAAHLADYTLSRRTYVEQGALKVELEWVPICFECKNPQAFRR